jgi:HlyD family secretion protein
VNGLETDPVMRVVDLSRLQISASLPVVDATRVLPGQFAEVQTEAGPQAATVALKLAAPSSAAPATDVRLNFITPTTLPIDSLVQVSIVVNQRKDVLVVPADAIQRVDTQTFVWMADSNNQATRREIKIGYIANGQAEVVSGLTAGEQVIVAGIAELTEGIRVVIGR